MKVGRDFGLNAVKIIILQLGVISMANLGSNWRASMKKEEDAAVASGLPIGYADHDSKVPLI